MTSFSRERLPLPPIHFHVLPIEEEDRRRYECDVKVLCVDRLTVCVDDVNVGHLGHCVLVLGKLRDSRNMKLYIDRGSPHRQEPESQHKTIRHYRSR